MNLQVLSSLCVSLGWQVNQVATKRAAAEFHLHVHSVQFGPMYIRVLEFANGTFHVRSFKTLLLCQNTPPPKKLRFDAARALLHLERLAKQINGLMFTLLTSWSQNNPGSNAVLGWGASGNYNVKILGIPPHKATLSRLQVQVSFTTQMQANPPSSSCVGHLQGIPVRIYWNGGSWPLTHTITHVVDVEELI